jgi:ATP-dependent RNA helicase DDX23/PRP28
MEGDNPRRRTLPVSVDELRRRREETTSLENRIEFVPRANRSNISDNGAGTGDMSFISCGVAPAQTSKRASALAAPSDICGNRERVAIRKHYMSENGCTGSRRSSRHTGEKFRFKFDWDADEDTTVGDEVDDCYVQLLSQSHAKSAQSKRRRGADEVEQSRQQMAPPNAVITSGEGRQPLTVGLGNRRPSADPRHWSGKRREEMTERDWAIFREDHAITMRGSSSESAKPARNWCETGLPDELLQLVQSAGYSKPSPIQMCAIPVGLRRRDLIGLAETGSGKTAAFVLPMLVHILALPKLSRKVASAGPYALVLAPTRELVLQIDAETRKFAAPLGFRVTAVIGGQGLEQQGLALQSGCEIVVCTPGRMVDLLSRQLAVLGNCNYLILDEADRMIDMGFEPQVQEILASMPEVKMKKIESCNTNHFAAEADLQKSRQTVMFSATMSSTVERLARDYLVRPVVLTIGEAGKAADGIDQRIEYLSSEGKKRERFIRLIRDLEPPTIVFVNTKKGCEDVARLLEACCGIRPNVLHSGKSQEQREHILSSFKVGRVGVLVATDLLGRGIDVKGVNHVVNFELPAEIAKYTHRIGRTGRAGRKGIAWSLATSADSDLFGDLKAYLEQSGARVPPAISHFKGGRHALRNIVD